MERQLFCLWVGRLDITKIPISPKVIYRFSTICIKIQWRFFFFFFCRNRKFHPNSYMSDLE